jgi:hypothetical protein
VSHIAVDLKVIEGLAASVARASGLDEDRVGWGLVRLWHHCWVSRNEQLTRARLAGIFGASNLDPLLEALTTFGFLEAMEGGWRVRGAHKYLRVQEGRSRGGKLASGNLKRGASAPASSRLPPGFLPASSRLESRLPPGLSPSTEHRAPSTLEAKDSACENPQALLSAQEPTVRKPKRKVSEKPPPDPRHAALVKALVDAAPGYAFDGGRDAKAVSLLLARGAPEEVLRRWKLARAATGYPTVRAIHELVTHWNHFAAASAPGKKFSGPAPVGTFDPNFSGELHDF